MPTYTVKAGDSLSKIARDVLGEMNRWPEIAQMNDIQSPYLLEVGQQLLLPAAPDRDGQRTAPVPVKPRAPLPWGKILTWGSVGLLAWAVLGGGKKKRRR